MFKHQSQIVSLILIFFLNLVSAPMIFLSIFISGLTLSKTCWELEDVDIRSGNFSELNYPSWWTRLFIGCLWRFIAIISQVFSIVVFLLVLWIHVLHKAWFSSYEIDSYQSINSIKDISIKTKGFEAQHYAYLIPISILVAPFFVNIWARYRYIGIHDEYSVAHGFLSAVIPVRYFICYLYPYL